MPIGAVQEFAILTNAFSAEFGWTAGPALNIVTGIPAADACWSPRRSALPAALLAGLVLWAAGRHYLLETDRRSLWLRCLLEGGSAEVRDELTWAGHRDSISWKGLEDVAWALFNAKEFVFLE